MGRQSTSILRQGPPEYCSPGQADMRRRGRRIALGLAVVVAYVAAAKLGFRLALVAEQVTTIWAPTGIGEAALILWGLALWPAVWAGAFIANITTHVPLWAAAGIATGNALESAAAAWVLRGLAGFDPAFRRVRDGLVFIGIGVAGATVPSATIGVSMLCAAGLQPWARFSDLWADWWLGDAIGALVVAPVLLTTLRPTAARVRGRVGETALWVALAMAITAVVFGRGGAAAGRLPLAFVVFPFVIVAAVRLGQPSTSLVILATAVVTVAETVRGHGPFVSSSLRERLVLAQAFMGVLAGCGVTLAAAIAERQLFERRRSAAYQVGEVLAAASSLQSAAPEILRTIGTWLDWQVGGFWLLDRGADRLRCVASWSPESGLAPRFRAATESARFPSGVGLPGRVWATRRPVWIQDVLDDSNFPRAAIAGREGLHGAFGFPVRLGEDVVGVVEFFNRSVAAPDPDLLSMMAAVGSEIGQFIGRKRIEARMAEEQHRTRAILETALDAIVSMDDRGRIIEFNPAAERTFGVPRADAIGRDLAALVIPARFRDDHRAGLRAYLSTGRGPFMDRRIETTALRADGREFPVELSITRVSADPPIFTGFVRDVTERAEAERERRRLLERELDARGEAEAANRAKDEFLATLSHELRTPLNAIVGWTRMLLDGAVDEATERRALQIIERNAQTQVQLVADILDVSRIITGKLALDMQPVDLAMIIGTVIDGARPAAEAKQIQIRSSIAPSVRFTTGDPPRIQQIVWNLISNAMKFTHQGGWIDVELSEGAAGRIRIRVADSGVGIAPEFIGRVFNRFSQADSSSTRQHGGLGLGLAIVRHLVELHGGSVHAASDGAGTGATFVVELPKVIQAGFPHAPADADAAGTTGPA